MGAHTEVEMGLFDFLSDENVYKQGKEVIRLSYQKHLRQAQIGKISTDDPPHWFGLYGALGSWQKSRGIPVVEIKVWAELAPFLAMNEKDSVEALAEYTIYIDQARYRLAALGCINRVGWCNLLAPDI